MIQGGDPTGTGRGGSSIWGENFEARTQLKSCCRSAALPSRYLLIIELLQRILTTYAG